MFNIFYNLNYSKKEKVFLTKNLKHSKLLNLINFASYNLKIPISNNLIFSGPNKRFNNLIYTFSKKKYSYNAEEFNNSYFVHFDEYSENILNNIINSEDFKSKKLIIGPLYNPKFQAKLYELTKIHPNIKMLVASKSSYEQAKILFNKINNDQLVISPSGVISEKELIQNSQHKNRNNNCLIYTKNRTKEDLDFVINFLKQNNINYTIFEYGKYRNKDLIKCSKNSKFGVVINRTESQGFAIQEMLSCNLPLFVWEDLKYNSDALKKFYGIKGLNGTSVPYWSDDCGIVTYNKQEFKANFNNFFANIESFQPYLYIQRNLTFEIARKKMNNLFEPGSKLWN